MLQIEPLPATYATKLTPTRLESRESYSRRIVTGPYVPTKKGSAAARTKTLVTRARRGSRGAD
jgi:hypothetical protein